MPIEKFIQHPALKPTVLLEDILENVYRPTRLEMDGEKNQSPAVSQTPTRERNRAA